MTSSARLRRGRAPASERPCTSRKPSPPLEDSDLARSGHLEKVGDVSVVRLLELWAAHDAEHGQEIEGLLRSLRDPALRPKPSQSLVQP